ncbi:hypothetical protein C0Z19_13995 [Trinickia soli]|uniref:Uncharacterized protein n=1 Tax=Trinickia soli TaxID=380675 RepID=A0A2N7W4P2_9BURK|nr:hypothetical protein C0Z19_13995 [Trinickia soli]
MSCTNIASSGRLQKHRCETAIQFTHQLRHADRFLNATLTDARRSAPLCKRRANKNVAVV